jgi:hypothetical protein
VLAQFAYDIIWNIASGVMAVEPLSAAFAPVVHGQCTLRHYHFDLATQVGPVTIKFCPDATISPHHVDDQLLCDCVHRCAQKNKMVQAK